MGIPWFDRIEHIKIYVDDEMPRTALIAITNFSSLQSIEIVNATQDESIYRNAIAAANQKIQLTINRR